MKFTSLIFTLFFVSCSMSHAAPLAISSSDIANKSIITNKHVFNGFGCAGKNMSPQISWKDAPQETKSFALTVYDPDAPSGSGWWHWMVINIPATSTSIATGAGTADGKLMPAGSQQIRTDFGTVGFGGACPPQGDKPHRYIFTLFALKVPKLDVPADATAALAGFMINANQLGKTGFTAYYGR